MTDSSVGSFVRGLILDFVPFLTVVLLILMTAIPTTLPREAHIGGLWPMIGVAYWSLIRPSSMSIMTVFVLGLLTDIISFVPFGLHAFVFILVQHTIDNQRRFFLGQGFWVLWVGYALLALVAYTILFGLSYLFMQGSASYVSGLTGAALSWACMPLVHLILNQLNHVIDLFDEPIA